MGRPSAMINDITLKVPWSVSEGAVSSVVEHYLDTVGVTGSNPVSRTIVFRLAVLGYCVPGTTIFIEGSYS